MSLTFYYCEECGKRTEHDGDGICEECGADNLDDIEEQ